MSRRKQVHAHCRLTDRCTNAFFALDVYEGDRHILVEFFVSDVLRQIRVEELRRGLQKGVHIHCRPADRWGNAFFALDIYNGIYIRTEFFVSDVLRQKAIEKVKKRKRQRMLSSS